MQYIPKEARELRTPVKLLTPTYTKYNGVRTKTLSADGDVIFCSWKSYGGTEQTVNGVYSIIDTAQVVTWYRPDILAGCVLMLEDGSKYEIISPPENIERQNRFCSFKVQRITGGV